MWTAQTTLVLWSRRSGDFNLKLCAARWGRLRGQLPSGDEDATNLINVLRSLRIEGRRSRRSWRRGDRGFGTARLGTHGAVNAKYQRPRTTKTARCAPSGCPHGRPVRRRSSGLHHRGRRRTRNQSATRRRSDGGSRRSSHTSAAAASQRDQCWARRWVACSTTKVPRDATARQS